MPEPHLKGNAQRGIGSEGGEGAAIPAISTPMARRSHEAGSGGAVGPSLAPETSAGDGPTTVGKRRTQRQVRPLWPWKAASTPKLDIATTGLNCPGGRRRRAGATNLAKLPSMQRIATTSAGARGSNGLGLRLGLGHGEYLHPLEFRRLHTRRLPTSAEAAARTSARPVWAPARLRCASTLQPVCPPTLSWMGMRARAHESRQGRPPARPPPPTMPCSYNLSVDLPRSRHNPARMPWRPARLTRTFKRRHPLPLRGPRPHRRSGENTGCLKGPRHARTIAVPYKQRQRASAAIKSTTPPDTTAAQASGGPSRCAQEIRMQAHTHARAVVRNIRLQQPASAPGLWQSAAHPTMAASAGPKLLTAQRPPPRPETGHNLWARAACIGSADAAQGNEPRSGHPGRPNNGGPSNVGRGPAQQAARSRRHSSARWATTPHRTL